MLRSLSIALAAMALFACSGQKEPAQKLLLDTDATIIAASAEAAKYVPQQLADVQHQYADLKASFDKQDYAGVISAAPAVLGAAQTLATAAAARKDEVLKALNDDWAGLAAILPGEQSAIQNRLEELSKMTNTSKKTDKSKMADKTQPSAVDLDGYKASLSEAMSLWSKATAAFAAGNLDEAVATAKAVKAKLDPLATALKVPVTGPSATSAAA